MDEMMLESERGAWLMSLALDGRLEPSEAEMFEALVAQDTGLGEEWALWQALDAKLVSAPAVAPSLGFVAEFERRRVQVERRRHLWFGFAVGATAAALWGSLVIGLAVVCAYVMFNQADWLGALVYGVAYWSASVQSQTSALFVAASTLFGMPQVRGVLLVYAAVAAVILFCWVQFLRRSMRGTADAARIVRPA